MQNIKKLKTSISSMSKLWFQGVDRTIVCIHPHKISVWNFTIRIQGPIVWKVVSILRRARIQANKTTENSALKRKVGVFRLLKKKSLFPNLVCSQKKRSIKIEQLIKISIVGRILSRTPSISIIMHLGMLNLTEDQHLRIWSKYKMKETQHKVKNNKNQ